MKYYPNYSIFNNEYYDYELSSHIDSPFRGTENNEDGEELYKLNRFNENLLNTLVSLRKKVLKDSSSLFMAKKSKGKPEW